MVPSAFVQLEALPEGLKTAVSAERTGVYVVVNRPTEQYAAFPAPDYADFDVPFIPNLAALGTVLFRFYA